MRRRVTPSTLTSTTASTSTITPTTRLPRSTRVVTTYSDREYHSSDELSGIPAAAPHARVPTSVRATELSHLHLFVLGRIAHRAIADVEDIARWLGVPVVVAEALCADLEAAGLLTKALGHR